MKIKKILILFIALLLGGCATKRTITYSYVTAHSVPVSSTDQNAQSQLAEAATSVGHSLQTLSAIQMAVHPHAKMPTPYNPRLIGMAKQVSLNWTGPVEPLLKQIAATSRYKLRVLGSTPTIPVIVSISARNQTLASVLRNVVFQARPKAVIKLYPATRTIELRYYSN